MTTRIAHVSDLHFGAENPDAVEALVDDLARMRPRVVAVSGDLTQRAREKEFRAAGEFLARIDAPTVVVPGNHDVPFYNFVARFLAGTKNYRRHIARDLNPYYADGAVALLGINTARSLTFKDGRVSLLQIERIRRAFADVPEDVPKALVTHHPFLPPPDDPRGTIVGRARQALAAFEEAGGDLVLCGHMHVGYARDVGGFHAEIKRSMLAIQAGTAVSRRHRGEPNAYNILALAPGEVDVQVRQLVGGSFDAVRRETFRKRAGRWVVAAESEGPLGRPRAGREIVHVVK